MSYKFKNGKIITLLLLISLITNFTVGIYKVSAQSWDVGGNISISTGDLTTIANSVVGCLSVSSVSSITDIINSFQSGTEPQEEPDTPSTSTPPTDKVPTFDVETKDEVTAVKKEEKKITTKEKCLDGIALGISKILLKKLAGDTVGWINNSFPGGQPFYLNSPEQWLKKLSDGEVNRLVTELDALDSNPLNTDVKLSLIDTYTNSGKMTFNLDRALGDNWQGFDNDFSVGGWNGWLTMTQSPANNGIGASLAANQELGKRIGQKQQAVKEELQQSGGFLSAKKCVDPDLPSNYEYNPAQDDYDECKKYETKTPGTVIAGLASEITKSNQQQLQQSDEINELLTNAFNGFFNKLTTEGFNSLDL